MYNPRANRDRMMSKVMSTRPRQEPRRRNPSRQSPYRYSSPPRYYGNRYHDNSFHDHEPNSPDARRRHYSDNLSEDEDTVMSHSRTTRRQSRLSTLNEAERYEDTLSNLLGSPSFDSEVTIAPCDSLLGFRKSSIDPERYY